MEKPHIVNKLPNPRKTANILSLGFFGYVVPTFAKGLRKELQEEDMSVHLDAHASKKLGDLLEDAWRKEIGQQHPSLWRAIRRVFISEFLLLGIIYIFTEMVVKISQPVALFQLMKYYTQTDNGISDGEAYMYAGLIVLGSFLGALIGHNYMLSLQHFGMKLRVACCSLIYRKSLRLRKTVLGGTTIGQMVNLLSNDVNRCDRAIIHVHTLWLCPLETALIIILLYYFVGLISTVGILFMVMFVPLQMYLGKKTSVFRLKTALKTDERIRLMNEIISGIQVIKMYTWEKPFAKLVSIVRKLEIRNVRVTSYIRGVMMSFVVFITRFSIFLTILTYVLLGNKLEAQYVFVVTSFYNILKQLMTKQFSRGITEVAEINVSISRLQKFLMYNETETDETRKLSSIRNGTIEKNGLTDNHIKLDNAVVNAKKDPGVELRNVSAKWSSDSSDYTLHDIDFWARPGQLIAIIGPVGGGKTSLLNVILKELPLETGTLNIKGIISYASQEPWVFSGSIQQNILFGQPMDPARYEEVVRVCALEEDLVLFPYGDKTLVGERGVMLSGGQRARVSLARAIYKEADIYLLDDPLSAVDTHVGKQLFENCINTFLRNKCTILVTHQLQYLRNVNRIFIIENGKITISGTYQELRESDTEFSKQLNESKEEESSGDTDIEKDVSIRVTKKDGKPTEIKEHRSSGNISGDVYISYFKAGGTFVTFFGILCVFIMTQMSASGADYFLTFWVNLEQDKNENNSTDTSQLTREVCIYIYSGIVASMIILTLMGTFSFYRYCMKASRRLHDDMFSNIVYASMNFFNTNSSGRILNRFAKDMGSIDEVLPTVALDCVEVALNVIGVTVVVSTVQPWLLLVTIFIFIVFYFLRIMYLATSRSVKRLEGITRSPVFGHMSASLQGLTTIRAYGAQGILAKEFDDLQDTHSSVWYLFLTCTRAFGFWLDLFCVIYIAAVTFSFFISESEEYGGNVGLAITQAMSLSGRFQWGMRQWSELENHMTSVERVVEYTNIEREPERNEIVPSTNWPQEGNVKFESVSLRYSPADPYVLKQLNFSIKSKEKIGIVGRTGAGKSSLIYALFQLTETEGAILIDDLDITKIAFHSLRSKISIIPQEPVLFSGSLRKNLDPFEEYSDVDLWNVLDEVELKTVVTEFPAGLNANMSEGGSNLSVGQRQLVCLARAIIRKNKILVLDEATANVDPQTDILIQNTIRRKFADCTVLTIAHRLHTIMDSDKVLVMEAGNAVEFDHPLLLLRNDNSLLYSMVQQTGHAMAEALFKIAEDTYKAKMQNR